MDTKELADAEQQWLDIWARGPQRVRWDRIPLQVGDPAPDLELVDHNGALTRLSSVRRATATRTRSPARS